tara:strand:+ start:9969 stop:13130 length:3162 start_codon:yes stop_codon:yes gene_type:complete
MAAYKNYVNTFYSQRGTRYDIEIWSKSETSENNLFSTDKDGFRLSYKGSDDRNNITKPSELTIGFIVENSTQQTYLNTLLSSDDTEYFLIVRRNFIIFWWGGLKAGFDFLENNYYPYRVTLKGTDYIGDFVNSKNLTDLPTDTEVQAGQIVANNLHEHSKIADGGANSFLQSCFPFGEDQLLNRLNNRWYGEGQSYDNEQNPFAQQKINVLNFVVSNGSKYSKTDAFNAYLKSFNMCAFQADGFYNVIQPYSYLNNTIELRKKKLDEADNFFTLGKEYNNITSHQPVENDPTAAVNTGSGFQVTEYLFNPLNFTDSNVQANGSVTSITSNSFNIAATSSYLYITLQPGEYNISFSQNDATTEITFILSIGTENTMLNQTGEAKIDIPEGFGLTGQLRFRATTAGTKTFEHISIQKGKLTHRSFLAGQQWRYQRPFGSVTANYLFGTSFAQLETNSLSTSNSVYTTLTNIGAVSSSHLEGAIFKTNFSYTERFDTLSQGIVSINGTINCKLKIGTQYLTGTIGDLSWTAVDSTFAITIPTYGAWSTTDGDYSWNFNNGPTIALPEWMSAPGSYAHIHAKPDIELPTIPASGAISFQFVSATINYYTFVFDLFTTGATPIPSTITRNNLETRFAVNDFLGSSIEFIELEGETNQGVDYTASTTNLDNFGNFDLGQMPIGNTSTIDAYVSALTIGNSSGVNTTPSFVQINGTGTQFQMTSLATQEYIEPQTVPLKMIEGEYYVNDFSAFKTLLLDGEKYVFLQGTLTASKDVVSGSWYKIADPGKPIVVNEENNYNPDPTQPPPNPNNPHNNTTSGNKTLIINDQEIYKYNSIGISSAVLTAGINYSKIDIINNARCQLYNNQKLLLTKPDGSNPIILTKNAASDTSTTQIDVTQYSPAVSYPIGSVLSVLNYDLLNVIEGENLAPGVTTSAIYLSADRFTTTSKSTFSMYTRDNLGSIQQSSYSSRNKVFASTFIPLGYKVTQVLVNCSQNRNVKVYRANTSNDTTVSLYTGNANTPIPFSTNWVSVLSNYLSIELEFGASSDEIYGAVITIQPV